MGGVISGLGSINVRSLAMDSKNPNILYVGTTVGVYKTTNGGNAWNPANSGLAGVPNVLVVDPKNSQVIYAGGANLFKSTDSGATWHQAASTMHIQYIQDIAIDPKSSNIVYAGTYGSGAFGSGDIPVNFDGDEKSDILWQQTSTGTVAIWLMNGTSVSSIGVSGAVPSDWQIKN